MITPAFPPFHLTTTELTSLVTERGSHTFRRQHLIDTGDGRFLCEEIKHYRVIDGGAGSPRELVA
jgi:hypothetical protein